MIAARAAALRAIVLVAAAALIGLGAGCVRPADQRALRDLEVGFGTAGGVDFTVEEGLAQFLRLDPGEAVLWAQAPALRVRAATEASPASPWILEIRNCMPGAQATATDLEGRELEVTPLASERMTVCRFRLDLPPSDEVTLEVAPPDAWTPEPFTFAVLGDIQTALPTAHELFQRVNERAAVRFVMCTGDLVETARQHEYDLLLTQLAVLEVPIFSTIGNHEIYGDTDLWHEQFGLYNLHFQFKHVAFSLPDSGSASLDPIVYERLEGWLESSRGQVHVFGTHFPLFDPVGPRNASFRSRNEAARLLALLAGGGVDITFYGHIHSYYDYSNAGMPAFISGGGGAIPERLDGVGRHFLEVAVDPDVGVERVTLVRVD